MRFHVSTRTLGCMVSRLWLGMAGLGRLDPSGTPESTEDTGVTAYGRGPLHPPGQTAAVGPGRACGTTVPPCGTLTCLGVEGLLGRHQGEFDEAEFRKSVERPLQREETWLSVILRGNFPFPCPSPIFNLSPKGCVHCMGQYRGRRSRPRLIKIRLGLLPARLQMRMEVASR